MGLAPLEGIAMTCMGGKRLKLRKAAFAAWVLGLALLIGGISYPAASDSPAGAASGSKLILVVGAPGEPEYGSNFLAQAILWQKACQKARFSMTQIGLEDSAATNDLELLRQAITSEPIDGTQPLWLVLIGHGSFDGKEARFNLRGPDLTATNLASWLQPFQRPLVILNLASCSAPFLNKLSGTNRVVVTATRSGSEQYYTRFGEHFAKALADSGADLDKDNQVSVLEAFIIASRRTSEFYKTENRLATEHALLDDNGDGLGTQGDWFRGLRATKKPSAKAAVDGLMARQICVIPSPEDDSLSADQKQVRDKLERSVFLLREKKTEMPEKDYLAELERLLLDLARLYEVNIGVK
jgi:hypothetical protein